MLQHRKTFYKAACSQKNHMWVWWSCFQYFFLTAANWVTLCPPADEVSVWDLDAGTVLSVFTPDSRIQCVSVMNDEKFTLLLGFSDIPTLISMTLTKQGVTTTGKIAGHDQLFGESSSSDEEDWETNRPTYKYVCVLKVNNITEYPI